MKKIIGILFIGALVAAIYYVYLQVQSGISIKITEAEINEQLAKQFPIKKNKLLFQYTLSDPIVTLKDGADGVDFGLTIELGIFGFNNIQGTINASGNVDYNPEKGEFFIKDAAINNIEITGLSESKQEKVDDSVNEVLAQLLNNYPIYTLDENDYRQSLAKLLVRSVKVKNKYLVITLGLEK